MPYSDIAGQDNCISVLKRSLASGRVAHAYLFSGIEGCGKRKTALAFIEAVFCGREEGCGVCPSCRKIAALQHPDLHLVEPNGQFIKIDQIRELQGILSYRAYEAPKKACIIDGAERLNPAAANALLKTLEEPPGDALMILLTSQKSMVMPTVLSRCQPLDFQSLSQELVEGRLKSLGVADETARVAASMANGSLKHALEISEDNALTGRREFLECVTSLSLQDIVPLMNAAERYSQEKETIREKLDLLVSFLRDIMQCSAGSDRIVNNDLLPLIRKEAAQLSPAIVFDLIEQVAHVARGLQRNVNARLALEVLFMRLAERHSP